MNEGVTVERFRSTVCLWTSRAIDVLEAGSAGDFISINEMEERVGRDCGNHDLGRGNVNSAIKRVRRENGLIWQWDRTRRGWRCLHDHEKPAASLQEIKRARRRAVVSQQISAAVDVTNLNDDQRRDHTLNVALAGVIVQSGSAAVRRRLSDNVNGGLPVPSLDKIESMFVSREPS